MAHCKMRQLKMRLLSSSNALIIDRNLYAGNMTEKEASCAG
jgi:hypothetical protein